MGENFKLKWNDHHSIFFSTAEELCMEDNLTDITLSCGKQEFSAHKLVLSICSTYFKDLFAPRQNQKGNSKYLQLCVTRSEEELRWLVHSYPNSYKKKFYMSMKSNPITCKYLQRTTVYLITQPSKFSKLQIYTDQVTQFAICSLGP